MDDSRNLTPGLPARQKPKWYPVLAAALLASGLGICMFEVQVATNRAATLKAQGMTDVHAIPNGGVDVMGVWLGFGLAVAGIVMAIIWLLETARRQKSNEHRA